MKQGHLPDTGSEPTSGHEAPRKESRVPTTHVSITSPVLALARASIRNCLQPDQHAEPPHRTAARMLDRRDVAKHET